MFEYAARHKLRFSFKGMISAEDLWDLNVNQLDIIFKNLNAERKQADNEESLLISKTPVDKELETKIAIVRHIVATKLKEAESCRKAKETRERKQHLMAILADKQEAELHSKSADEIMKMIEELEE